LARVLKRSAHVKRSNIRTDVPHADIEQTLRRVREVRERMQRPRANELDAHTWRRAEDRFRDEHHDAHAKVISVSAANTPPKSSAIVSSGIVWNLPPRSAIVPVTERMRIRVVKRLPAPVMDDFDVRRFLADHTYDVDAAMGRYLILAGYAVAVDDDREPDADHRTR
jgi:hypothetical protein